MHIHACLMTQNELLDLVANVQAMLPHVDSVTIVDGGSLDGTIPFMRNWSKQEPRIRFFIHPWKDDFPAQRNNYLSRVGEIAADGDWILAIDPDEVLDEPSFRVLRQLPGVVTKKLERYARIGFRCRSVSLRGAERDPDGAYRKDAENRYCNANRRFGCVIAKDGNVIAQGFNARTNECSEGIGCVRDRERIESGSSNDRGCIHAEQAALQNYAKTGGSSLQGATVYVNAAPCLMCAKLLLGCGIDAVVVPPDVYGHNGVRFLSEAGIEVRYLKL